jgi:hypothetical protein
MRRAEVAYCCCRMFKLNLHSIAQLVLCAVRNEIIQMNSPDTVDHASSLIGFAVPTWPSANDHSDRDPLPRH